MKIVSPISDAAEVEMLSASGADEFYCGVAVEGWSSSAGLNRRDPAHGNLGGLDELIGLCRAAHDHGCGVQVAFNTQSYPAGARRDVLGLVRDCVERADVDGVILADPELMLLLQEEGVPVPVTLSSTAACTNREAMAFFREAGASRVVLPRHLRLAEILDLARARDGLELEAFVLNDNCVFEEGRCGTVHDPARGGAFCLRGWEYVPQAIGEVGRSAGISMRDITSSVEGYKEWIWNSFGCGFTYSEMGLPNGPCGLCAMKAMSDAGVTHLKVVGREASAFRKLRSVQVVAGVRNRIRGGATGGECEELARGVRNTPDLCASGYMCYYREARAT